MFNKFIEEIKTVKAIDVQIYEAKKYLLESAEPAQYDEAITRLNDLIDLKTKVKSLKHHEMPFKLDINSLVGSAVGLATVILVLRYEDEDIVTSKAFGIATKMLGK